MTRACRDDSRSALPLSARQRAMVVAAAWLPLLHVLLVFACALAPWTVGLPPWWGIAWAVAALYLLPPLIVRIALALRPLADGEHRLGGSAFLAWWFSAQWQVVFNRLPELEELLRLVPGLYSAWLRLWGSRIGSLTYWGPQCRVLDRSLLHVGDRVVFGVGARLHPHLLLGRCTEAGPEGASEGGPAPSTVLVLGRIRIGSNAMVGGFSLLSPGVEVAAGEATDAVLVVPPWSRVVGGRRVKGSRPTIA